jgi:hypothetical protein
VNKPKVLLALITQENDFQLEQAVSWGARRAFEEVSDLGERDAWLKRPVIGCDGVPKSGQRWVREGRLSARRFVPPGRRRDANVVPCAENRLATGRTHSRRARAAHKVTVPVAMTKKKTDTPSVTDRKPSNAP